MMGRREGGDVDTDGIRIKRDVLRRVVNDKLEALLRGDFYVRNLGQECYEPIVGEVSNINQNGESPGQQPPAMSEDLDKFIQLIAGSIMIDAALRGENDGESDPKLIKKKKKLLAKTLKGPKLGDFKREIMRFDRQKRGLQDDTDDLSLKSEANGHANEHDGAESASSDQDEEDGHDSLLSDTSATSISRSGAEDGFSTSATSSKRHKKKKKKDRKRRKKEKKKEKREKRKREKEKIKAKKRHRKHGHDKDSDEASAAALEAEESFEAEGDSSYIEERPLIRFATKEEFEKYRDDILSLVPQKVKSRFREGGFSKWGKDMLPILEIGPFDIEPGPVREMWVEMFNNTRVSGREMTRLVFWYGVKYEERGQAYSFVPENKIIQFEDGESKGYCEMPKKIKKKLEQEKKLTKTEEQIMRGLTEIKADMKRDKTKRIDWMMKFQEDYERVEEGNVNVELFEGSESELIEAKSSTSKNVEDMGDNKLSSKKRVRVEKPQDEKAFKSGRVYKPDRPKKKSSKKVVAKGLEDFIVDEDEAEEEAEEDKDAMLSGDEIDDAVNAGSNDDEIKESDPVNPTAGKYDKENHAKRKRKAQTVEKKPKKKPKSEMTEEERQQALIERRKRDAIYREKKRKEKAEALGIEYVPGERLKKKSKKKIMEEEQARFSNCEMVFLPIMERLRGSKDNMDSHRVSTCIGSLIDQVEVLTPPFLRSYPLGMLIKDIRKSFESSDPEIKELCKRLTNEMKRVYTEKEKSVPDDFVPKKLSKKAAISRVLSSGGTDHQHNVKRESNHVTDSLKTEDLPIDSKKGEELHVKIDGNRTKHENVYSQPDKFPEPSQNRNTDAVSVDDNPQRSAEIKSFEYTPQRHSEIPQSYENFPRKTLDLSSVDNVPRRNADAVPSEHIPRKGAEINTLESSRSKSSDTAKTEAPKPSRQVFSIKGMFEKPKPTPKPKFTPNTSTTGRLSPKPKVLPSWVTGPAVKIEFHEQHAKNRSFALEFLGDASSVASSDKFDSISVSRAFELAIFAETKLRGKDWSHYWEKVHDVVAMLSPPKNQTSSILQGIANGDYQEPSELVKLSRREIQSLNQRRAKS